MFGDNINYKIVFCDNTKKELFDGFDCTNDEINKCLYKAYDDYINGWGVTKLIIDMDKSKLIGYYTLCSTSLIYDSNSKDKIKGLPAIEIKMFAIDKEYQNMPYSEEWEDGTFSGYLLNLAISEIQNLSDTILGIKFIILYAVPNSIKFYKDNGFSPYEEYMIDMYDRYLKGCTPLKMLLE